MTLEQLLTACVVLQFLLLIVLFSRISVQSTELRIVYRFMRRVDESAYRDASREELTQ